VFVRLLMEHAHMDGGSNLPRQQRRLNERRRKYTHQDFHREAEGVVAIGALTPPELLLLATTHPELARGLSDWIDRIEKTRPICATCDAIFTIDIPPSMWAVARPDRGDARGVMLMGFCASCCDRYLSRDELIAAAAEQLRKGMWPDLRVLDAAHFAREGGRA
jgi:hypothetical protein